MKETGLYYVFKMYKAQETAYVAGEKRTEASQMRFLLQLARISISSPIRNELLLQNLEVDGIP
jgi:hypothetical protein